MGGLSTLFIYNRRTEMHKYKYEKFESIQGLVSFLNEKKILEDNIINIDTGFKFDGSEYANLIYIDKPIET